MSNFTAEQIASWGPQAAELLREALGGAVETPSRSPRGDRAEKQEMVKESFTYLGRRIVATIPCVTRSEANESKWTRKMRRKLSAKRATRDLLGKNLVWLSDYSDAYHRDGKALRVTFTRLGGRRLDACNLPSSMKAIEDVVAGALLADDGDPRWHVGYEQEPGGPVGVRVEIEVIQS